MIRTALTGRLGIALPIIQAPMAGGATTTALVAAVCEAGGLGTLAGGYLTPQRIAEMARELRGRTSRAFGLNLFAPLPPPDAAASSDTRARAAVERVAGYYAELGLPAPAVPAIAVDPFEAVLPAALDSGASVISFTFGLLPPHAVEAIKTRGITLIGTATTVDEAMALEASGVDAIVAQGSEAGAHRGTFLSAAPPSSAASSTRAATNADFDAAMVGTMALVPQIVDEVKVPVIASGGIMDGRGIAAALALGASAVQMGTAFLTCDEAGIADAYKQAILSAHEHQTRVTRAFSGRHARGIVNRFMSEVEVESPDRGASILPYPMQNTLTRELRTAASAQGRAEFMSLWAGQGVRLARRQKAADLVARLADETIAAIRGLQSIGGSSGE